MDFGTVDLVGASEKGAKCHLNDPVYGTPLFTDKGEKITIHILGRDSAVFRKAIADANEQDRSNPEAAEVSAIDVLVSCVTGWNNIIWNGKPLEFTEANVRMFLTKFPPVRAQLDRFLSDRANFFKDDKKA